MTGVMSSLPPGTRIGPYEVRFAIGAGGPPPLAAACGRQLWRVSPEPGRGPD
ncbi:MAG TPA: hypothetical protein VMZ90_09720 [Vicinamibacterales bacterium]|nr:hypothetical protein [Vicinamibacterales bacterium]